MPAFPELGAGRSPGQAAGRRRRAITIADLTGTGVQDTAIATLARATRAGRGRRHDFETVMAQPQEDAAMTDSAN